jgi:hypothetical protein
VCNARRKRAAAEHEIVDIAGRPPQGVEASAHGRGDLFSVAVQKAQAKDDAYRLTHILKRQCPRYLQY